MSNKKSNKETMHPGWERDRLNRGAFSHPWQEDRWKECFIELCGKASWKPLEGMRIIEVGPGYGYMARWFMEFFKPKSYTIVDSKYCIDLPRSTLGMASNIKYITNEEYEKIFDDEYDLFVSIQCLTEVPKLYAEHILHDIDCKWFFIIDAIEQGKTDSWGEELYDPLEFYNDYTEDYQVIPSKGYKHGPHITNNKAFLGKKRDRYHSSSSSEV
jgi:hypothetical protein